MGYWQPVGSAAASKKRLVPSTPTPEEKEAADAKFRAMAAEGRAPLAPPTWREDCARQSTGKTFDTRAKFQEFLKKNGLVELDRKNPGAGIERPKVDRQAILENAFELGRRDIAQGKPIEVPTAERPMVVAPVATNAFSGSTSIMAAKKDAIPGGMFGLRDTGAPDAYAITRPRLIPGEASTADAERDAYQRMRADLFERTGENFVPSSAAA